MLNTIVAESIDRISGELEKLSKEEFNSGLQHLLSRIISAHKRIIFNGNGYTDEWKKEAAKRGLPNAATTMEALRCLTGEENIAMFEKYHVYNRRELESRYEVFLEDYHNKIRIEGETALEIAGCMVQPAVAKEFAMLTGALADAETAGVSAGLAGLRKSAGELGTALDELSDHCGYERAAERRGQTRTDRSRRQVAAAQIPRNALYLLNRPLHRSCSRLLPGTGTFEPITYGRTRCRTRSNMNVR